MINDKGGNKMYADVLVEATFEPKNPETLTGITMIVFLIIGISAIVMLVINYRKLKWLK